MLSKKNLSIWGIVVFLFIFLATLVSTNAQDTTSQIITHIDEILNANPLKPDQKVQRIVVAQDDSITILVMRGTEGAIKPHIHKTHNETVYAYKGTVQMLVNDKWVDLKPGTLHFNPMGKVHGVKASEPFVAIIIFTPGLKQPDQHFVE
jgi:quercetin dioxygenase-like cupin family protein